MCTKVRNKVDQKVMGQYPNTNPKSALNAAPNYLNNSSIHQNMYPGGFDPKAMMANMEGQPMNAPQYMMPPGTNNLSNYNFSYQSAPGYMMHPMASQMPPAQNMQ
jgi:hypothetical protein